MLHTAWLQEGHVRPSLEPRRALFPFWPSRGVTANFFRQLAALSEVCMGKDAPYNMPKDEATWRATVRALMACAVPKSHCTDGRPHRCPCNSFGEK